MKNMLIEIFKPTPIELTLEELEKKLYGRIIAGKTKENILNDLKLLELEGKIFYDARNNTYKTFPSNFFITKVTSVKDNEFYFKINTKEYNLPNKNNLKKKDTIILEKVHNRFKFIIQNIEQEKSNDYDRIVDLFDAYNKSYSLHALAKIIKTNDLTTLQNTLTSLEGQGKVYFNEDENKYQPFPKQYKIVTIETGKKGFYYIRNKDSIYPLKDEETIGILPFDKVILEKTKDGFSIIKVLKRNNPNIICEVTEKGIRVVGNNNIKVRCNEKEFKDLRLPIGTRILVKIGTKETNKVYDVSFIEVTGHKNDLTSELEEYAKRASIMERCADKAEYEANKLYMVKYVKEHFDETFEGFIQDITPQGLIIKTKELIEGIIFFEDLDDGLYTYNKECRWLEHKNNNKKIMIGSKVLLTPKELDEEFRVIYFNGNSNTLIKEQTLKRKKD